MNLEERVDSLERVNGWWRRACFMLMAALGCVVLLGQGNLTPAQVEAQKFVVKDAKGRVRAEFGAIGKGAFGLVVFDDAGRERTGVYHWREGTREKGTGFFVLGSKGEKSISLFGGGGNTWLSFNENVTGQAGASLSVMPNGYAELQLRSKGDKLFEMALDRNEKPSIEFREYGGDAILKWPGK